MLSESLKSYLRAIYFINHTRNKVRVKGIASFLNVRSASVTEALTVLVQKGFITHQPYKDIKLTKEGYKTMQEILHRQRALFDFLYGVLAVKEADAQKVVSRIGDALSDEAMVKLNILAAQLQKKGRLSLSEIDVSKVPVSCEKHSDCAMCRYYLNQVHSRNAL